jgi:hypothetical protein
MKYSLIVSLSGVGARCVVLRMGIDRTQKHGSDESDSFKTMPFISARLADCDEFSRIASERQSVHL